MLVIHLLLQKAWLLMSGLEPAVFLAKGAKVMLTMNLWVSVGLCDGATGTVIDIIYEINH